MKILLNKKRVWLSLLIILLTALNGCTEVKSDGAVVVFAAASLTEPLTQIVSVYQKKHPETTILLNFDSSGTLKTQIEMGADCDIFISAAEKQMNELTVIEENTRVNLLENRVVLAATEENPSKIQAFDEIEKKCSLIAIGNEDVPVGQYAIEILKNLGCLNELTESHKITYGSNVKEVVMQIAEGSVDCGIIYETDALSQGLFIVEYADSTLCGKAIYPAAMIQRNKKNTAAIAFYEYLLSPEGMEKFLQAGFGKAS